MRRALILTVMLSLLAAPSAASARLLVGIGDQLAPNYNDRALQRLQLDTARLALAWDWYKSPVTVAQTDAWIEAVRAARLRPLISFNRNWGRGGNRRIPSLKSYLKSFRLVRERYPQVREFSPWNEPNRPEQPFYRKPALAAKYFNAMRAACRTCTVLAADINDGPNMVPYLLAYKKRVRGAKVWALHNYKDATRVLGTTRLFLSMVRGPVWLTETGGMRARGGLQGMARSVRRVFELARSMPRIKRIYFYQWRHDPNRPWDSAFLSAGGKRRPAFYALRAGLQAR